MTTQQPATHDKAPSLPYGAPDWLGDRSGSASERHTRLVETDNAYIQARAQLKKESSYVKRKAILATIGSIFTGISLYFTTIAKDVTPFVFLSWLVVIAVWWITNQLTVKTMHTGYRTMQRDWKAYTDYMDEKQGVDPSTAPPYLHSYDVPTTRIRSKIERNGATVPTRYILWTPDIIQTMNHAYQTFKEEHASKQMQATATIEAMGREKKTTIAPKDIVEVYQNYRQQAVMTANLFIVTWFIGFLAKSDVLLGALLKGSNGELPVIITWGIIGLYLLSLLIFLWVHLRVFLLYKQVIQPLYKWLTPVRDSKNK